VQVASDVDSAAEKVDFARSRHSGVGCESVVMDKY
jgi:hypothetical protein